MAEAMRYSLLGGGKRIRGALILAFYRLYNDDVEVCLPFACAIEMIHAYSLIHDDLPCMDDDDMRRGKPSSHIAFSAATALLAGDALLTLAFELMSKAGADGDISAERVCKAIYCLAHNAGVSGMIEGQAIDLMLEGKAAETKIVERMYAKKTAALLTAASSIGCLLAGAGEAEINAAEDYATYLGMAFQITDDILDITGDEALLGKRIGSDSVRDKRTLVSLLGLDEAKTLADCYTAKAIEALESLSGDTSFLVELADMLAVRDR